MSSDDTVTVWIHRLRDGDESAAEQLWTRYFRAMVASARRRLRGAPTPAADEEDVALSAFRSLCTGAGQGRFPQLRDRSSLWALLVTIIRHKSIDLLRHNNRQKRGGGVEHTGRQDRQDAPDPAEHADPGPPPELAVELAEEFERLMDRLAEARDPQLQEVVVGKLEGATNAELAQALNCTRRTIERKLKLISSLWHRAADLPQTEDPRSASLPPNNQTASPE